MGLRTWLSLLQPQQPQAPQSYCLHLQWLLERHLVELCAAQSFTCIPAARPPGKGSLRLPVLWRQEAPKWLGRMPTALHTFHGSPSVQPQMSPLAQPTCPTAVASPLSPHFLFLTSVSGAPPHPRVPGLMPDGSHLCPFSLHVHSICSPASS